MHNGWQIPEFTKDTLHPSIFSAKDVNMYLVRPINAILRMMIRRGISDQLFISDMNIVFQISRTGGVPGNATPDHENPEDGEIGAGCNAAVYVLQFFPDGHIMAGGQFNFANGFSRTRLASFRQNLTLRSPSWFIGAQNGGLVGGIGLDCLVTDLDQKGSTQFWACGEFVSLGTTAPINLTLPVNDVALFKNDGTIDTSFVPDIILSHNDDGSDPLPGRIVAVQTLDVFGSSGCALIGGSFDKVGSTTRHSIALLNPDGTLNSSLDCGLGFNRPAALSGEISPHSDGCTAIFHEIVGGGDMIFLSGGEGTDLGSAASADKAHFYDTSTRCFGGLVKISSSGAVDSSFTPGTDGDGVPDLGLMGQGQVLCIHDGAIYVGGPLFTGWSDDGTTFSHGTLVKLDFDGNIIDEFNPIFTGGAVQCAAIDGAGRLVIGGTFNDIGDPPVSRIAIARLNATTGALDTTFPNLSVSGGGGDYVGQVLVEFGNIYIFGGKFGQVTDPVLGNLVRNNIFRCSPNGKIL